MHRPIGVKAAIREAWDTLDRAFSLAALLQRKSPGKRSSENC